MFYIIRDVPTVRCINNLDGFWKGHCIFNIEHNKMLKFIAASV